MYITNEMYDIHFQPNREEYVKLSLLQTYYITENSASVRKFRKVGEIQGNLIDGSISINANSDVRRTCGIDLIITDNSFLIGKDTKIWLDKYFRVEIGIMNFSTNNIVWFDKGLFAINNPQLTYDAKTKKLHIEGLDLMCTLNGTLGGSLTNTIVIPINAPLRDAISSTVKLGAVSTTNQLIEYNSFVTPYEIKKDGGTTIYDVIKEIAKLYMTYEIFFDEDGNFIYRKVKDKLYADATNKNNDIISYSFIKEKDVTCSYDITYNFDNVNNKISVYGRLGDDGSQPKAIVENTDPSSPFNTSTNMGVRPLGVYDDKIFTTEQATQKANYEFWLHNDFNEKLTITCLPIYFLDVNQIIEFSNEDINLTGRFLIDEISIPLGTSKKMTITTHRLRAIV